MKESDAIAKAFADLGIAIGAIVEKMLDKSNSFSAEPRMLDAKLIAEKTGLSREKIYREFESGKLKGVRIGRRVVFKSEDVNEWLEKSAAAPKWGQS